MEVVVGPLPFSRLSIRLFLLTGQIVDRFLQSKCRTPECLRARRYLSFFDPALVDRFHATVKFRLQRLNGNFPLRDVAVTKPSKDVRLRSEVIRALLQFLPLTSRRCCLALVR